MWMKGVDAGSHCIARLGRIFVEVAIYCRQYQVSKTHEPNVGSMLVHRLRRWPRIDPALGHCLVFAGSYNTRMPKIYCNFYENTGPGNIPIKAVHGYHCTKANFPTSPNLGEWHWTSINPYDTKIILYQPWRPKVFLMRNHHKCLS